MSALELRNDISKDISTMPVPMLEALSRYIKILLDSKSDDEVSEKERDALFLASVSGKWEDSRSADEILCKSHRKKQRRTRERFLRIACNTFLTRTFAFLSFVRNLA